MNQQEMHDEQIKDKLRMKDDALKIAISALYFISKRVRLHSEDEKPIFEKALNACKEALEA